MRNTKGMRGMLFMAATMAAMGEKFAYAEQETHRFTRKRRLLPKSILTVKQQKARDKEKRAKIARKINRL
jgi:hypothetical protein